MLQGKESKTIVSKQTFITLKKPPNDGTNIGKTASRKVIANQKIFKLDDKYLFILLFSFHCFRQSNRSFVPGIIYFPKKNGKMSETE